MHKVVFFGLLLTDGGMKRLDVRSSLLSTEEKVGTGTKAPQTTEPQLFYIVCCRA